MIPPGCLSFSEARSRAWDVWRDEQDGRLQWFLQHGELKGYAVSSGKGKQAIAAAQWSGELYREATVYGTAFDGTVVIDEQSLNGLLGAQEPKLTTSPASSAFQRNKGGRPEEYDWDGMWIEIVRIMRDEGMPEKRVELRKRMQQWFGDQSPADNTIRPKIERLFKRLDDPDDETQ